MASLYVIEAETGADFLVTEDGFDLEIEYYADNFSGPDARFIIVELDVFTPGVAAVTLAEGHLTHPHLALAEFEDAVQATSSIFASDLGYRKLSTDAGGIIAYPPLLDQAFQVDNKLNLDPGNSGVAATWGSIDISNANDQFDAIAGVWNSDGRGVRILTGVKTFDRARQYHVDPAYASLATMWTGVATPWFLSDTALTVPIRDATYWLERPYQTTQYNGTGGYNGTAALTGKPIPRTRGGTSTDPVRNVTPTLMDPLNRIYQYSDGRGTVVHVYEGAAEVFSYDGDTTNLYAGGAAAGHYRTDNSRGLFQLGSIPVHTITADVTGQFPSAGSITTFAAIARYMLTEDMLLPPELIDLAAFAAVDTAYPYVSGVYFDSNTTLTGVDVMTQAVSGPGGKLIAKRNGRLAMMMLRAPPSGTASAVANYDLSNIVMIAPVALPNTLDPPPYRLRSEYAHNYTVQTSDLNLATATAAQQQFVGVTGNFAAWSSTAVLIAYRRPNDPPPITGMLLRLADAQTVVNDLGALWGVRRRLYDVTVPAFANLARDIGDIVTITYPMDDLAAGRIGQIVGYSFRTSDATTVLRMLV